MNPRQPTPDHPDNARIYKCDDCGTMFSKAEGGTVFTCCGTCMDKRYPTRTPEQTETPLEAISHLEVPQSVLEASQTLHHWAITNGLDRWQIGYACSRAYANDIVAANAKLAETQGVLSGWHKACAKQIIKTEAANVRLTALEAAAGKAKVAMQEVIACTINAPTYPDGPCIPKAQRDYLIEAKSHLSDVLKEGSK